MIVIFMDIFPIICKGIILGITFFDEKNHWDDNNHDNYKYDISDSKNNTLKSLLVLYLPLVPLALLIYFIIATLRSYIMINFKKFMDLKFFSIWKLLGLYGLIGAIFCSFFCLGTTYLPCAELLTSQNKKDIIIALNDYQCKLKDDKYRYIDSYSIFFNKWIKDDTTDIQNELIMIIFGSIAFTAYNYFTILIIKEFSPLHKILCYPIQYLIEKIIISYKFANDDNPKKFIKEQYFIDIVSDIVTFFGFLIYLEIIELNFFGFNNNLTKNIIIRGKIEENISLEDDNSSSTNEDKKNEELNESVELSSDGYL